MGAPPSIRRKTTSLKPFNVREFLESVGVARKVLEFKKAETIFSQGDSGMTVLYLQKGTVRLSVVKERGKKAVVAVFTARDFFGGRVSGGPNAAHRSRNRRDSHYGGEYRQEGNERRPERRTCVLRPLHLAHARPQHPRRGRSSRSALQSSEKRLARALLLLARYGREDKPEKVLLKIPQEMLAEMVGTTRSRVNVFMNTFRTLGLISYNSRSLQINKSLLSVVLHE
jgi:CRP/FNR family cyclic AMP-dependent transcriptional regulator